MLYLLALLLANGRGVDASRAAGGISGAGEYQIKAAFLYNFAHLVQWSEDASGESSAVLTLGVIGEDPFGEILDYTVKKLPRGGRSFLVKRFAGLGQLEASHILFVCASESGRIDAILERARGWKVLTVGEMEGFAQRGGVINFTKVGEKIRFEINRKAAERAQLKISSRMLRIATLVEDESGR